MEDDKASGPDGFPIKFLEVCWAIKFLKVCWEVVDKDVMATLEGFHSKVQWCKILGV